MKLFLLIIFSFLSFDLLAQNDPCGCNAVLVNGVYNYRFQRGNQESLEVLKHFIVRTSYDEFMKSRSYGGGGSYAGIGLEANITTGDYTKKQQEFISQGYDGKKFQSSEEILEKYGDKNVLDKWLACKQINCDQSGLKSELKSELDIHDDRHMTLTITYQPIAGSSVPVVQGSRVINGKSGFTNITNEELLPINSTLPVGQRRISITRLDTTKPLMINITLSGGRDISEYIPAYIPPKPYSPSCEEIKKIMADQGVYNIVCNKTTANGYYWQIDTDKIIDFYGGYGLYGYGECLCNKANIGATGESYRWKDENSWFNPVYKVYRRGLNEKGESNPDQDGPKYGGSTGHNDRSSEGIYLGVYKATCKEYNHIE